MINLAIEAAKEAGNYLKDNFGKIKEIRSKGDRNLATNVDNEAERIIVDKIKNKYPQHGILAEENERENLDKEWLWIIDPLDGTHNFIRNIGIFGVSIGLVFQNNFVGGVIYMPLEDELYVGEEKNGAYKNNKKITISSKDNLKECTLSFDSSIRYKSELMAEILRRLSLHVFNIRMFGSSVRTLSYLAEGNIDITVEFYDRPWDFAGGVCIVKEAGGIFTDLDGNHPTPKTIGYLASNPLVYSKVIKIIKDIRNDSATY